MGSMSSLYAQYIKEREDFEIIETDKGFATYKIFGEECYLRDIYVSPENRRSHVGLHFLEGIEEKAREAGCKYIAGTVSQISNGKTDSLIAILKAGFKLHSSTNEKIVLVKEL
jgi:GNAT superfamily N-acetyltransferase